MQAKARAEVWLYRFIQHEDEEDETLGYIAINHDGSEILAAGYSREDVDAAAQETADSWGYVIEEASEALLEYWSTHGNTPTRSRSTASTD